MKTARSTSLPIRAIIPRPVAAPLARELPTAAVLGALVLLSAAVRFALGRTVPVPTIFPDELVYSELGRSFADSGQFIVRDTHVAVWTYGPLYPILVSPAFLFSHSTATAFAIVKAINAALFSLAAVPAYFLARRVVGRHAAFAAAGLALLVPSGVYSTKVMAESASYPLFLLAMLAFVAALERPSRRNQLLALGAIGLATLARAQMAILLPAFLSAICIAGWIEGREAPRRPLMRSLSSFRLTWLTAAGAAAAVLGAASSGVQVFGTYGDVLRNLRLQLAPERLLWLVGDLDLYSGVVPFTSFLLFVAWAVGRSRSSRRVQLFAVAAASASLWLFGLAAVYTTAFAHVYDRYVFYLVPLFTIALLAWIEHGLPRPARAATFSCVAAAALLPFALPLERLLSGQEWGTSTSSVALVPWALVGFFVGHGVVLKLLVLAFSIGLALTVARARRDRAWSLVRITAVLVLLASFIVGLGNAVLARSVRDGAGSQKLDWIDAAVGPRAEVALLWRGDEHHARPADHRFGLREATFFNDAVGPIYDLESPLFPGLHSTHVSVNGGRVVLDDRRPIRAQYVLAAANLHVDGVRVAANAGSGLLLYRVSGLLRVAGPVPRT